MIVYAVFQEGVYRHDCAGIFSTEELAREHAIAVTVADTDDYHAYDVVPFPLDERFNPNPPFWMARGNSSVEAKPIASYRQQDNGLAKDLLA